MNAIQEFLTKEYPDIDIRVYTSMIELFGPKNEEIVIAFDEGENTTLWVDNGQVDTEVEFRNYSDLIGRIRQIL